MRNLVVLLAAAAALPSVAVAGELKPATEAQAYGAVHRVYVCEMPVKGRQAWSREHGWLRFSSADELLRTRPERGAPPVCVTEREVKRLQREAPVVSMTLAAR